MYLKVSDNTGNSGQPNTQMYACKADCIEVFLPLLQFNKKQNKFKKKKNHMYLYWSKTKL